MISKIETWIFTATHGLAQQEIQRIKADVQQHFADACLAYQEKGLTISEAEARALADLGDAALAQQRYRVVYFTQDDEYRLQKLKMKSWWSELTLAGYLLLFGFVAYNMIVQPQGQNVSISTREVNSVVWLLALLFEVRLKKFFAVQAPNHQVFWIQVLAIFLAHPFLIGLFSEAKMILETPLTSYLPFDVLRLIFVCGITFFSFKWLQMQLPLTIKAIRRLRA
jgi:hypothetical protein